MKHPKNETLVISVGSPSQILHLLERHLGGVTVKSKELHWQCWRPHTAGPSGWVAAIRSPGRPPKSSRSLASGPLLMDGLLAARGTKKCAGAMVKAVKAPTWELIYRKIHVHVGKKRSVFPNMDPDVSGAPQKIPGVSQLKIPIRSEHR